MSKVIAVTGKGGTGKTMLSALMVRLLGQGKEAKILAIDADSSVSLSYALGLEIGKTLSDIRADLIDKPGARKEIMGIHVKEVIKDLVEYGEGFDLLVMGRSEGPGCYCGINDLLRYGIESLSKEYDFTLIDGEAGPEQINRRVLRNIDTLLIVTDTSHRGFKTADVLHKIADRRKADEGDRFNDPSADLIQEGLVINRLKGSEEVVRTAAQRLGLRVFGYIPEDENISEYDLLGKPLIDLPESSPVIEAVRMILEKIGL